MKKKVAPIILFLLLLYGMSYTPDILVNLFNINIDNFSKTALILFNFGCDLFFMVIVFLIYRKEVINNFKDYIKNFKENFTISFRYYIIGLFIMLVSNVIINIFFKEAVPYNENIVKSLVKAYPLYMLFSVSIFAPFVEEIVFRKCIYDIVYSFKENRFTKYIYIIISSLIFAILHVAGYGNSWLDYLFIVPYLSLSTIFAILYYKKKNIFLPSSMHALHNTVAILIYFIGGV